MSKVVLKQKQFSAKSLRYYVFKHSTISDYTLLEPKSVMILYLHKHVFVDAYLILRAQTPLHQFINLLCKERSCFFVDHNFQAHLNFSLHNLFL